MSIAAPVGVPRTWCIGWPFRVDVSRSMGDVVKWYIFRRSALRVDSRLGMLKMLAPWRLTSWAIEGRYIYRGVRQ